MEFENSRLDTGTGGPGRTRRVWNGFVRGHRETWVLIDRTGEGLGGWLEEDARSTPLLVCRAILDDGVLILAAGSRDDGEPEPLRLEDR